MITIAAALLCALSASGSTPAAEGILKSLGLDPADPSVRGLAAETVHTNTGVYSVDALAAKGDVEAVKAFLVTRDFLRDFREDPDIEFPDDETYDIRYLTEEEKLDMGRRLMKGIPAVLPPGNWEPREKTVFGKIRGDRVAVDRFLATRDYVRKAAAVNAAPSDAKLALALKRPKSFDARYLFEGEVAALNSAVKISLAALAESLMAPEKR